MSNQDMKKFLFEKNYDKKYVFEVTDEKNTKTTYPLNLKSYKKLMSLKSTRFETERDDETFITSDSSFKYKYKMIKKIKIKELKPGQKIFKNKDNAFFKHLNTTDLDLTRYQIISENDDDEIIKEHCVIHSLRLLDIDEAVLNNVKLSFQAGIHISLSSMDKICDILKKKIIIHSYRNENKKKQKKMYGKKYEEFLELASFDNHMFIYEKTKFNKYFIDNYEKLRQEKNRENIYFKNTKRNFYSKDETKRCDSLYLVKKLYDKGLFKTNSLKLRNTFQWEKLGSEVKENDIPLTNINNESRLKEFKKKKITAKQIFYADTETITTYNTHKLLLFGIVSNDNDDVNIFKVKNFNDYGYSICIKNVFDYVLKMTDTNKDIIIYFHNLKYDYSVIQKHVMTKNVCYKDGVYYSVILSYKGKNIELRDTMKYLNFGLKKFCKTFQLDKQYDKKEAIAYRYYDFKTSKKEVHSVEEYKKHLKDDKEKILFIENLNKEKELFSYDEKNNTFDAMKYYDYYLKYDCLVLKKGFNKFKDIIYNLTGLSIYDYLTISSLTFNYFLKNDTFKDVYEISGNLREFVSKAIKGGRVSVCKEFKKKHIKKRLCDYDACSLYPSAIYRMCKEIGLPKGKPKLLTNKTKEFLDKQDYYIVKIRINKINKKQQNPFISVKNDKGILQYVNEVDENNNYVYVDKITLEDYINFHKIEYDILKGIYYNEGYNKKMGQIMEKLYNDRLKYKKLAKEKPECNAIQNTIKLMMNSAYGKTILGKSHQKVQYIKRNKYDKENKRWSENDENKKQYLYNYFNQISSVRDVNKFLFCVKSHCVDNSFNLGSVGCLVLSYSKRIMHEVMNTANENNINIYYNDTDSLHIEEEDIPILEQKYNEKYKRILKGKYMCQFHTDFDDIEFDNGEKIEPVAIESIFLGKKVYIDKLMAQNSLGQIKHNHHFRMKGVNDKALKHFCNNHTEFKGDMMKLYKYLSSGKELKIPLNPTEYIFNFEYIDGGIKTKEKGSFIRTIKF